MNFYEISWKNVTYASKSDSKQRFTLSSDSIFLKYNLKAWIFF